jgi:hypothetical protein
MLFTKRLYYDMLIYSILRPFVVPITGLLWLPCPKYFQIHLLSFFVQIKFALVFLIIRLDVHEKGDSLLENWKL